jgi:hypothetical protein
MSKKIQIQTHGMERHRLPAVLKWNHVCVLIPLVRSFHACENLLGVEDFSYEEKKGTGRQAGRQAGRQMTYLPF